jgi:hypothetical protein
MYGLTGVFGGRIDFLMFRTSPTLEFNVIFMTFSFFIINAHIEIYFNVRTAFLDVVHYKTLNTRLDI